MAAANTSVYNPAHSEWNSPKKREWNISHKSTKYKCIY